MPEYFAKKFVIITAARTGSNALVNALTAHPSVHCDYEVFHPLQIYTAGDSPFSLEERERDPVAFLQTVMDWNRDRFPQKAVYGFKLFFPHNQAVYDHVIADPEWKKIVLRRRNLLDQFTSELIARASHKWNSDHGQAEKNKVEIKFSQFKYFLKHTQSNFDAVRAALKGSGQAFLGLEYEDVAAGRFDIVCDFLEVDGAAISTHLKKQNSPRSADKIVNAEEVKRWLQENGYLDWWVD